MTTTPSISAKDRIKIDELRSQVQLQAAARVLWGHLTADEQRKIGEGGFEQCFVPLGTLGMWQKLCGQKGDKAVVELGYRLDLITAAAHERLQTALGNKVASTSPGTPVWNRELGQLSFNGVVIRKIRIGVAKNLIPILDAFQRHNWPARIDNPIPGEDDQRMREAIAVLNRRLEKIRFHSDGTGSGITWQCRL